MSDLTDFQDEMGRLSRLSERDLDRLFAGTAPADDEGLEEVAAHLRDAKMACVKAPAEATVAHHVSAVAQAAQLLADKGEPVARPASKAHGPDRRASGLPKWRRRFVFSQLFATLTAKIAAASIAAAAATGGLAAAGALPDPVQRVLADLAGDVGISLPSPDEDAAEQAEVAGDPTGDEEDGFRPDNEGKAIGDFASDPENEKGCEFGQRVSDLADDGSEEARRDGAEKDDPCKPEGSRATGEEKSGGGRATADEKSGGGQATADEKSAEGKSKGESAGEEGQSNNPGSGSEAGKDTGDDGKSNNPGLGSDAGKDTGDTAAEEGQSNKPPGQGKP